MKRNNDPSLRFRMIIYVMASLDPIQDKSLLFKYGNDFFEG
jgi:hypothetical protein